MANDLGPKRPVIDLKAFEKRIRLRKWKKKDYDALVTLQQRCFPKMKPWSRDQFNSMLAIFPEGQFCLEVGGQIAASASSLIVDFDLYSEWHNWSQISDGGYIRNHNPQGDTLYGIEIMVDPEFRGMRLARRLYQARKKLCRDRNLQRIVIGGRIPGYAPYCDKMSASEYVDKVKDKTLYDPVLTTQLSNGFTLHQLIPDYLPSDEDSAGYATHMEWINLEYMQDERRRLNPVQMVRLCAVQYQMRAIASFEEFAQQVSYFVDVAADYKCDFIVFPELITLQLLSFVQSERPGTAARKLAEFTPRYLELFTHLAVKFNINIVGGSHFTVEDDKLFNIAYLFRRNGTIGKQYKLHITPSEKRWWGVDGGRAVEIFNTDRGRIAIAICYDIQFPEIPRIAAKKGAQILFCPFNTDERHGYLRVRYCAQTRCIENHMYTVMAGCVGNLPFAENVDIHYAQSGIYTPSDFSFSRDGIGAECMPNIETVVMHDVDLETLRRHKYTGTTRNWNDRRRDLYRLTWLEGGENQEI